MSRRRRTLGILVGSLTAAYLGFLALGGVLLRGCVERGARERIASALDAEVTIGATSFSVWRGRVELEDVVAIRKHGGTIELRIDSVDAEMAGWGRVLIDRDIDRAVVRGAHMSLSARGLAGMARRERKPLELGELVVEDSSVAVMPTALMPGIGRVEATLTRAVARPASLTGGLSWLDKLVELDATVDGPGGLSVATRYRPGSLALSGSWFGAAPITLPFAIPHLDPDADELAHIRVLITEVVRAAGLGIMREAARGAVLDALKGLSKQERR
jgi:hypothetical protein